MKKINKVEHIQCKNCGEQFDSDFCPNCGQSKYSKISHKDFLKDYLHDVIGLDGKIWNTLKAALLHPGKLTNAFLKGKKQSYVTPIKLYLLIVFMFFFFESITDSVFPTLGTINSKIHTTKWKDFESFEDKLSFDFNNTLTYENIATKADSLNIKPETKLYTEQGVILKGLVDDINKHLHIIIFLTLPLAALVLKIFYSKTPLLYHFIHLVHLYTLIFIYAIFKIFLPFSITETILDLLLFVSIIASFKQVYGGKLIAILSKVFIIIILLGILILITIVIAAAIFMGIYYLLLI